MNKINLFFVFIIFFCVNVFSQVVNVPLESDIYGFLERMMSKRIINYHDEAKPFSRKMIASRLMEVNSHSDLLNPLQKEELDFFNKEFAHELNFELTNERWHLFKYSDTLFSMRVNPVAGYEINSKASSGGHTRWWGANVYGSASTWFGFALNMRDRGEFGNRIDRFKGFSPARGAVTLEVANGFENSDVRGSLNFDWGWGGVSLQKDYVQWGHGQFGQLIFSDKAPSFPLIKFDLQPTDWLRLHYVHGWLNSLFLDSIGIYYRTNPLLADNAKQFVKKYFVANLISISPYKWLDFSIGNSHIYKGDLRAEMFIPFMFFKYLDRDTGHGSVEDGNGALFSDMVIKYFDGFRFYYTLFIDCIELRSLFKGDPSQTWAGFTVGGKAYDLVIPNLDVSVEYTRCDPWLYEHKDSTTTYKHLDYTLGHWIGQNADQLRLQFDYRYIRGLKSSLFFERVRKGGFADIAIAYTTTINMPFLYGPVRKETTVGLDFSYEYLNDLFAKTGYRYTDISDESFIRTPRWQLGGNHYFYLSLQYGL